MKAGVVLLVLLFSIRATGTVILNGESTSGMSVGGTVLGAGSNEVLVSDSSSNLQSATGIKFNRSTSVTSIYAQKNTPTGTGNVPQLQFSGGLSANNGISIDTSTGGDSIVHLLDGTQIFRLEGTSPKYVTFGVDLRADTGFESDLGGTDGNGPWKRVWAGTYKFGGGVTNNREFARKLYFALGSDENVGLGMDMTTPNGYMREFYGKIYDATLSQYVEAWSIYSQNRITTFSAPAATGSTQGQTMIFKGADSVNGAAGDAILAGGVASGSGAPGHAFVPRGAGTPSTTPASRSGLAAVKVDDSSGAEKVCFYVNAVWKCAALTAP
jgi:hypothetical protein